MNQNERPIFFLKTNTCFVLYKLLLYILMVPPKYHWYVEGVALHSAQKAL
ncbi:uncharacterized protein METZ01_LOCUS265361 [marine metagenome]|uniref:Uncharacterized protein n=1 Tax=marine metagenome TaxID=408172 RepID=A0A382JN48_9ZZZZ